MRAAAGALRLLHPLPSRATLAAVPVLLAAFFTAFYYAQPTPASLGAGLALMALGLALRLATNAVLKKNQEVCRDGWYAVCRHPMYLGTLILALGIAVALNHPSAALLVVAALVISLHRMRREEAFLALNLPGYAAYRDEVPAFPTPASLLRFRAGAGFSLRQCFINGEILRFNLYLPLIVAAGVELDRLGKLPLPRAALVAGAAVSLAVTVASAWSHPADAQRSRLDYLLPGALGVAVLVVLWLRGAAL